MRLELTKKSDLAVRALTLLSAHDDQPLKGSVLAERLGTSVHYLPKVMKPLVERGWIISETGPTGGYRSSPQGRHAVMLDLIEAVEGPFEDGRCVLRDAPCPTVEECGLHTAWSRARRALIDELRQTRVVDGASPVRAGHPHQKGDNQ